MNFVIRDFFHSSDIGGLNQANGCVIRKGIKLMTIRPRNLGICQFHTVRNVLDLIGLD